MTLLWNRVLYIGKLYEYIALFISSIIRKSEK